MYLPARTAGNIEITRKIKPQRILKPLDAKKPSESQKPQSPQASVPKQNTAGDATY